MTNAPKDPNTLVRKDTNDIVQQREQRVLDKFMLEEYKNISKAHFELHSGLRQMFRFYLGVVAVPVTIFAFIYKEATVTIENVPSVLSATLCLIGVIGFLMFLSLINMRFDIIFYTRTVNGTRGYFIDRAKSLNARYHLLLPDNMEFPAYQENPTKAYWWQFLMITLINTIYLGAGIKKFNFWTGTIVTSIVFFITHVVIYYFFAWRRKQDTEKMLSGIGR
jgi:hypothetical protein